MITASEMGKKGGKAKAKKMTKRERSEHAIKMLKTRWEKHQRDKIKNATKNWNKDPQETKRGYTA